MGIVRLSGRLLVVGLGVMVLTALAVLATSMVMMERHGPDAMLAEPVDAAIVLGGGVDPDGVLGYSSRRRVWIGVRALERGEVGRLILSGGAPGGIRSSAERMAEYAVQLGANPEKLLLETRARSTFQNLRYSFRLAEQRGFDRLALVTDAYHLARAALLARYFGRGDVALIAAEGLERETWPNRVFQIGREAMAWWYNLAKVGVWEALGLVGWDEDERMEAMA